MNDRLAVAPAATAIAKVQAIATAARTNRLLCPRAGVVSLIELSNLHRTDPAFGSRVQSTTLRRRGSSCSRGHARRTEELPRSLEARDRRLLADPCESASGGRLEPFCSAPGAGRRPYFANVLRQRLAHFFDLVRIEVVVEHAEHHLRRLPDVDRTDVGHALRHL